MRNDTYPLASSITLGVNPRLTMDEAEFCHFHAATVHPLRAYLTRMSGDVSLADDLVQDAYCRWLELARLPGDPAGRRRYLFRIVTNLFHDHYRRTKRHAGAIDRMTLPTDDEAERRFQMRRDVGEVFLSVVALPYPPAVGSASTPVVRSPRR